MQGEAIKKPRADTTRQRDNLLKKKDVTEAARDAEPQSSSEEQQLEREEQAGRQRAKDEDPLLTGRRKFRRQGSRK